MATYRLSIIMPSRYTDRTMCCLKGSFIHRFLITISMIYDVSTTIKCMSSMNALIDTFSAILLSINTHDNAWSVTKVFSVHELLLRTYVKWLEYELAGIILCMRPANEKRPYSVTSFLIGLAHTQNDPWIRTRKLYSGSYCVNDIDGLVQDCSISIALAMETQQPCTKPSL